MFNIVYGLTNGKTRDLLASRMAPICIYLWPGGFFITNALCMGYERPSWTPVEWVLYLLIALSHRPLCPNKRWGISIDPYASGLAIDVGCPSFKIPIYLPQCVAWFNF